MIQEPHHHIPGPWPRRSVSYGRGLTRTNTDSNDVPRRAHNAALLQRSELAKCAAASKETVCRPFGDRTSLLVAVLPAFARANIAVFPRVPEPAQTP